MTVRSDVTVDWSKSPRIITVAAPSTNITIQDIVDTCRSLESDPLNLSYDRLIDAAGKQNLGGGVLVGITATLNNALLAFEARSGPTYVQCTINGGNLVAVDSLGAYQSTPVSPTAFTQVILTSSSSATLQQSDDIEYASFNGGVSYLSSSPYSGTAFPVGTPRQPVNNWADALSIANTRGFDAFYLDHETVTLNPSLDYSGFTFEGPGETSGAVVIPSGTVITNCGFSEINVSGVLDGGAYIEECQVGDLQYLDGLIQHSILTGTIILGGDANLEDVAEGLTSPTIDFNGTNAKLAIKKYSGALTLKNKTSSIGAVSIDLDSGILTIDSSCTAGTIIVRGVGQVINNGTSTVDTSGLVNKAVIADSIWNTPTSSATTSGTIGKDVAKKQDVINSQIIFGK